MTWDDQDAGATDLWMEWQDVLDESVDAALDIDHLEPYRVDELAS
jgi:hypothetical protein